MMIKIEDNEFLGSMPTSIASFVSDVIQKNKIELDLSEKQAHDIIEKEVFGRLVRTNLQLLTPSKDILQALKSIEPYLTLNASGFRVSFMVENDCIQMYKATKNNQLIQRLAEVARYNSAAKSILESDVTVDTEAFEKMLATEALTGDNNTPSYKHMMAFSDLFEIEDLMGYDTHGKAGKVAYTVAMKSDIPFGNIIHGTAVYKTGILANNDADAFAILTKNIPVKEDFWFAITRPLEYAPSDLRLAISTKSEDEAEKLYDLVFSDQDEIRIGSVRVTDGELIITQRKSTLSGKMKI